MNEPPRFLSVYVSTGGDISVAEHNSREEMDEALRSMMTDEENNRRFDQDEEQLAMFEWRMAGGLFPSWCYIGQVDGDGLLPHEQPDEVDA